MGRVVNSTRTYVLLSLIDRISLVEFEHRSVLFDAQEG
jgi:hypothetical protein